MLFYEKINKDNCERFKNIDIINELLNINNNCNIIIDTQNKIEEKDDNDFNLLGNNEIDTNIINNKIIIDSDETEINTNSNKINNKVIVKKLPSKIDVNNLSHTQSFIQNKLNLDDSIQIFLKIKQNGLMKSITLESNYCFKNNLNTEIILSFIDPNEFKTKFLSEDKNIDHVNNKINRIIINPGENKPIPMKFIMNHFRVYANLFSNKNNNEKYVFLYKDFTFTQNNLSNYIKYDKSKNDDDYELENNSIKIKFDNNENNNEINNNNNNNNFIFASLDFTIQRSANKSVNENSYKKNNFMSLYFYLFSFNYYSSFENQLPFDVKIINVNNNENYLLKPLENLNVPNLNLSENKFKICFNYFNNEFISDEIDSNSIKKTKNIKLFLNSNEIEEIKEKFIKISIKIDSETNSNNFDPTIIKLIKNFTQKKKSFYFSIT
jgi:hypothetical protein